MSRRESAYRQTRNRHVNSRQSCPACAMLKHILSAQARQAGFTIVEVLVAVVVFAVGLLAIAGMQTQSISQSTFSDQTTDRTTAIANQAETLIRLPVLAKPTNNIAVDPIFTEANMSKYGDEWPPDPDDEEEEDDKPYTIRQRVVQGYPLPNLAMIELEAIPKGVREYKARQRTVRIAFVRSLRWN